VTSKCVAQLWGGVLMGRALLSETGASAVGSDPMADSYRVSPRPDPLVLFLWLPLSWLKKKKIPGFYSESNVSSNLFLNLSFLVC
jgi:hypothetical protein